LYFVENIKFASRNSMSPFLYGLYTTPFLILINIIAILFYSLCEKKIGLVFISIIVYLSVFKNLPYGYYEIQLWILFIPALCELVKKIVQLIEKNTKKDLKLDEVKKYSFKMNKSYLMTILQVLLLIMVGVYHYRYSPNNYFKKYVYSVLPQVKCSEIIGDNPFMCLTCLDTGFYLASDYLPDCETSPVIILSDVEKQIKEKEIEIRNHKYRYIITDSILNDVMNSYPEYKVIKEYQIIREAVIPYVESYKLYELDVIDGQL